MTRRLRGAAGVSLMEVLIVLVILGATASVVMLSGRGPRDSARTAACREDLSTLRAAENAHYERFGVYATEDELVATKALPEKSDRYAVAPSADKKSYTVTATGDC